MRTISISTALFDGYPMNAAIDEIAASGASHVEPAFIKGYVDFDEAAFSKASARALRTYINDAGLAVGAVSAHLDLAQPESAEMLARRIDFAAVLNAPFLITNTGTANGRTTILNTIGSVLPQLVQSGVTLALENPGHGSGDLIGNGRDGARLIEEFASPSLCLNYDAGNVFTYSNERLQPADDIAIALDMVGHVHLKDIASAKEGWSFCAIGDGSVDYGALWPLLPRHMPLSIELPLRLERPLRAGPRRKETRLELVKIQAALSRSLAFVRALDLT